MRRLWYRPPSRSRTPRGSPTKSTDALFFAKIDYLAGTFVPQVPDAPIGQSRAFAPGAAQFAVTAGAFLTTGAFGGQLCKLLGE